MRKKLGLRGASALAIATFLTAVSGMSAHAQEQGSPDEIIVTAQKRSENVQEVPAAISVISGDVLDGGAAYNIEGIQNLVPTLNFRKGGTSLNSSLFLRGVGTINFSVAAEPSVAFVLDGVVMGRAGEAFGDLYDAERIEVLRGPQGTLFGKNASAGVVNVVSRMPGDTYGGQIELTGFEGEEYKVRASVDVPVSESFRTRLTAFAGQYEGNINNLTTGDKINGYDRWGMRGIAQWDVSPDLQLTFIGDYRHAADECCGEVIGTAPTGATGPSLTSLLSGVNFLGDETRNVRHNLVTQTKEEAWGASLQADYQLSSGFTLTSITAYRSWDNVEIREGDWLDRPAAFVGNGFAQLHDFGPQSSSTLSQELRMASPEGERLEYVAGLYYYKAEADRLFRRDDVVCTSSTLPLDANGQRACTPAASTFVTPFSTATFGSEFENWAVFGNGSLHLTDRWSLIGGLRYTNDEVSYYHNRTPAAVAAPGLRTDATGFRGSASETNVSGKAGVQYQIDGIMAYGTYTRGYKGPAFNVFFNQNPTQLNVIEAETADAYEVGMKTTWLDGRLLFNIALYDATYDNFQANNFDLLNGVVITRLTNAGNVSTSGFDIDFIARPTDNLTINGGWALNDAEIDCFNEVIGGVRVCTSTRSGETLALAPRNKGSIGFNYDWTPDASPLTMHFNGNVSYVSEQFSDLGENPLLRIPSHELVDLSIGFSAADDRYRLTFMGKNLTDKSFASLITPGGPGGGLRYLIPREADRYFGVSLRAKWGQ